MLAATLLVATALQGVARGEHASPEQTAAKLAVGAIGATLIGALAWIGVRRRALSASEIGRLAIVLATGVLAILAGTRLLAHVRFPADILIWSESDFVADIIKLRTGRPVYAPEADNESFPYMPGAQALTWLLSSAVGMGDSIVAMRAVQLLFTITSAVLGTLTARRLLQGAGVHLDRRDAAGWAAFWTPMLFLVATNGITNPFTFLLHNDALNLLLTMCTYWLLVEFTFTRSRAALIALIAMPMLGFVVKQSSVLWVGLVPLQLWLFDPQPSFRRAFVVGFVASVLVAAAFGLLYALWGADFIYWVFTVLKAHGVSPIRSLHHAVEAAPYWAAGLVGGMVLLPGPGLRRLIGLWLVWLALMATETYTSGIAWMMNHIGPASLIGGVWFAAAVTVAWRAWMRSAATRERAVQWMQAAMGAGALVMALPLLDLVHLPEQAFGDAAYGYVRAIEQETDGIAPTKMLVDVGSWTYLRTNTVQKDRAPTIGERGLSQSGDFSGVVQRLNARVYDRILVRHFHEDDMWYDAGFWNAPSGVRAALEANYREVRTIPGVKGPRSFVGYLMDDISVLEPIPLGVVPDKTVPAPAPVPSPAR